MGGGGGRAALFWHSQNTSHLTPHTQTHTHAQGNPNEEEAYEYISSYSPMENVPAGPTRFPPTLLTAGLHDNRVCYWEPAKYCQRLRAAAAEPGRILLKTDMGAGHFSYSDRYAGEEESAFELAFLLHHLKC